MSTYQIIGEDEEEIGATSCHRRLSMSARAEVCVRVGGTGAGTCDEDNCRFYRFCLCFKIRAREELRKACGLLQEQSRLFLVSGVFGRDGDRQNYQSSYFTMKKETLPTSELQS